MAADSKVIIDDNALFRQKELAAQEDKTQDNPREAHAKQFDLNFIHIGENIGCLVNGAGLAMSTMDIISLHGGSSANILDVGDEWALKISAAQLLGNFFMKRFIDLLIHNVTSG